MIEATQRGRPGAVRRLQMPMLLLTLTIGAAAAAAAGAAEQRYVDVWGPAVGSQLPVLDALDHTGQRRDLESLTGSRGLLLFLNRSADW